MYSIYFIESFYNHTLYTRTQYTNSRTLYYKHKTLILYTNTYSTFTKYYKTITSLNMTYSTKKYCTLSKLNCYKQHNELFTIYKRRLPGKHEISQFYYL